MFRLVSNRYERASMIVTLNKPFSAWGEIFGDDMAATAMVDRLIGPLASLAAAAIDAAGFLRPAGKRPRARADTAAASNLSIARMSLTVSAGRSYWR